MNLAPGATVTLTIERPAVGGRMIARAGDAIVLVSGAIPGEQVVAAVERVQRRTVFARTVDVLAPSPDRVEVEPGLACGGQVLAHVSDARQALLKAEMLRDAFRRQARLDVGTVPVVSGPADGYRTRARAHVRHGRWGFFEAGSQVFCDIAATRQLSHDSAGLLDRLCAAIAASPAAVAEVEWAESITGGCRVAHVAYSAGPAPRDLPAVEGLEGLSWSDANGHDGQLWGTPWIAERLAVPGGDGALVDLRHHVGAFFQGNRFLLAGLAADVARRIEGDDVADLYAGVGLFSVLVAATGRTVTAVEGDRLAAADLQANAVPARRVRVHHRPVEAFVRRAGLGDFGTVVVDPPRSGLSPEVGAALTAAGVARLVYVSCDPATLARDVRRFVDAGYHLADVQAHDLFPRTAHIETVLTLTRRA